MTLEKGAECKINACSQCYRAIATPDLHWQHLSTHILIYKGQEYLLFIYHYSKFPELALLRNTDFFLNKIIAHLKPMFSRHGIPKILLPDDGCNMQVHN